MKQGNTVPCRRAATPTIISTAFPKDAFRRPERVSPSLSDNCSVASPNSCRIRKKKRLIAENRRREKSPSGVGSHYLCKRHNGDEAEREPQGGIPIEMVRDEAQRNKHEQDVRPGSKQEILVGFDPSRLAFRDAKEANDSLRIRMSV